MPHYKNFRAVVYCTAQSMVRISPEGLQRQIDFFQKYVGVDKVYLCKGGRAHAVEVTTGLRTDAEIQILEGLSVGDTLITSGTLQLRECLPVKLDTVE